MSGLQKTTKVHGKRHTYRRLGNGAANSKRFGDHYFQTLQHGAKVRAVIFPNKDSREFHVCQILSPTKARELITWLATYIAKSNPDPVSISIAATKSHAKEIVREQANIAKELGL